MRGDIRRSDSARATEFRKARAFLDRLPGPQIVVPGNHDMPTYRVWERLLNSFGNSRRYIDANLETSFAMMRSLWLASIPGALTFKGGRINTEQMSPIQGRLADLPGQVTKVVVTHHPFDLPEQRANMELVGGARMAMEVFSSSGVDLLLVGHFHTSQAARLYLNNNLPTHIGNPWTTVQRTTAQSHHTVDKGLAAFFFWPGLLGNATGQSMR